MVNMCRIRCFICLFLLFLNRAAIFIILFYFFRVCRLQGRPQDSSREGGGARGRACSENVPARSEPSAPVAWGGRARLLRTRASGGTAAKDESASSSAGFWGWCHRPEREPRRAWPVSWSPPTPTRHLYHLPTTWCAHSTPPPRNTIPVGAGPSNRAGGAARSPTQHSARRPPAASTASAREQVSQSSMSGNPVDEHGRRAVPPPLCFPDRRYRA
mgnify:CR=1 FL=1